jgi:ferredoxin
MSCFDLRPCNQMGRREVDIGTIIKCSACLERSASECIFVPQNIQGIIRVAVSITLRRDTHTLGHMSFTRENLEKLLLENHTIDDPKLWKDGYSDKLVSIEDAKHPREIMGSSIRLNRPFSMSLEKPHSRWLREDGSMSLHDPENCTLTKTCINLCKASFPPAILPQLKRAIELRQQVQYQKPCRSYHAEVELTWKR